MMDEERGWLRLCVLLQEPVWGKRRAVFIIAGLDPKTTWPTDEFYPIRPLWLPGGLRPEWQGLTSEQLETRVVDMVRTVETKLYGLPSPCTPVQCLAYALEGKHVPKRRVRQQRDGMLEIQSWEPSYTRPGVIPPWLEQGQRREEIKPLLPPDPHPERTAANARWHRWGRAKSKVRQLWDAYRFREASYENEGAFIRHVLHVIKEPGLPFKIVEQWLRRWKPEVPIAYGDISIFDDELSWVPGAVRTYTVHRGYDHEAVVEPPKAGRPKKHRANGQPAA